MSAVNRSVFPPRGVTTDAALTTIIATARPGQMRSAAIDSDAN
jgi:hypothetical protein